MIQHLMPRSSFPLSVQFNFSQMLPLLEAALCHDLCYCECR